MCDSHVANVSYLRLLGYFVLLDALVEVGGGRGSVKGNGSGGGSEWGMHGGRVLTLWGLGSGWGLGRVMNLRVWMVG